MEPKQKRQVVLAIVGAVLVLALAVGVVLFGKDTGANFDAAGEYLKNRTDIRSRSQR